MCFTGFLRRDSRQLLGFCSPTRTSRGPPGNQGKVALVGRALPILSPGGRTPAEGGCARRVPWREGKCVGLALAAVSRARDPWTRPTRARHPFASAAPGGEPARAPRCAGGRGWAEGERKEEDPAFSRSPLPGQRPTGSGSSLPRRRRHRPVLGLQRPPGPRLSAPAPRVARKRV